VLVVTPNADLMARLASAVERGGATPVLVRDLATFEASATQSGQELPFRFVVCAFDGSAGAMERICARLRPATQLVAVVPRPPWRRRSSSSAKDDATT